MQKRHTRTTVGRRGSRNLPKETEGTRDEIVDWLKDAYAMERGLEKALEKQSKNDELSSMVRERAASHLEETRHHAEEVRSALQSLGSDTSALKTGMGNLAQTAKGVGSMFARDERIKDLLDAYSMEHFEIACYTALAAAAQRIGLTEVVEVCERILPDEQRMAEALIQSLPDEVQAYLFEAESAHA
jgi:ferritin-like metal-binding protein YciE